VKNMALDFREFLKPTVNKISVFLVLFLPFGFLGPLRLLRIIQPMPIFFNPGPGYADPMGFPFFWYRTAWWGNSYGFELATDFIALTLDVLVWFLVTGLLFYAYNKLVKK
jgi:hypothetical protein